MSKQDDSNLKVAARKSFWRLLVLLVVFLLLAAIPSDLLVGLLKFIVLIWAFVSAIKFALANRMYFLAKIRELKATRARATSSAEIAKRMRESQERKEKQLELNRQRGIEAKRKHKEEKIKAREQEKLTPSKHQTGNSAGSTASAGGPTLTPVVRFPEAKDFGQELQRTEPNEVPKAAGVRPAANTGFIPSDLGAGISQGKEEVRQNQYFQRLMRVNQPRKNSYIVSASCGICASTLDLSGFCRSGCRPLEE